MALTDNARIKKYTNHLQATNHEVQIKVIVITLISLFTQLCTVSRGWVKNHFNCDVMKRELGDSCLNRVVNYLLSLNVTRKFWVRQIFSEYIVSRECVVSIYGWSDCVMSL